jgi:murein DD-endopeptidase MepM/ murein hydrolase activator NlpD
MFLRKSFAFFLFLAFVLPSNLVFGATPEELKAKIEERNNQIKQLEEEIKQTALELDNTGKQKATLQSTIKTLDLTQKKITTDLSLTQTKIKKTELTIEQLQNEIDTASENIQNNKKALGSMIRNVNSNDSQSFVLKVLSSDNISNVWKDIDNIQYIQAQIKQKSDELRSLTDELETKQGKTKVQKNELVGLKQDLTGKKQAVVETKQEKATLLAQTKNKEQTYKELLKAKEAQKAQFEKDLYAFEAQLNIDVDPAGYPKPKRGILSWPLDKVIITQEFGQTVAAKKLYTSGSHNGVDFGASVGTRVKSVLDGTVAGTGNTDAYPGCYSFGKWVMIDHGNGLSSIYGHLSSISVSKGAKVATGDTIGYSGNTGYTTGPHLHLGLYATQGVRIEQFVNSRGCKQAIIPLADIKAYLDPLAYLPLL